jgi:fermentation-respiration switch protein FrsA (DUF1100 family)
MKKMVLNILIVAGILYTLILVSVYFFQGRLVYFPTADIHQTPQSIGLKYEEIVLTTSDNVRLSAWYIPSASPKAVVLFCHGNAGNISHRLDTIRIFHDIGLDVLIFDYRGYGKSEGRPSERGTYLDVQSAWNYLTENRKIAAETIVLFGRSLGSAVAAEAALVNKPGALIVESGFTSVPDIGKRHFPFIPVKSVSRFHYATIEKVGLIRVPKLFIHSPADEIIPFSHGKRLYEYAVPPKGFLQIEGDHNSGFLVSGSTYVDGLDRFITKYF